MSENIFESLPEHLIIEELDTSLMTGNGDLLSVQGKTNVTISFAGHEFNASVVVAKLEGLSVIIGLDFLVKCNGILYSPHFGEVPSLRKTGSTADVRVFIWQKQLVCPEVAKCSFRAR